MNGRAASVAFTLASFSAMSVKCMSRNVMLPIFAALISALSIL